MDKYTEEKKLKTFPFIVRWQKIINALIPWSVSNWTVNPRPLDVIIRSLFNVSLYVNVLCVLIVLLFSQLEEKMSFVSLSLNALLNFGKY